MKKILLLTLIATSILSCQNNKKQVSESETIKTVEIDDAEKAEKIFGEFKALYTELLNFKDKNDFQIFGFGEGGPYNSWLKSVEELKNNTDSKILLKKGVLIEELEQLGLAYVVSKGKETEVTKNFNRIFTDAISEKPIEKVKSESGNADYDKIKNEYELFGKWRITNSVAKLNYPYEIYTKGAEYIGVIAEGEYKTEILEKKGDNYFIKGNKSGEYYKIDSKMNMLLFDKDGELASMGYKAIKE